MKSLASNDGTSASGSRSMATLGAKSLYFGE